MNTASALKSVCAALYGTSSYNSDFSSTLNAPHHQWHHHSIQPTPIHHEITDFSDMPALQNWNIQPEESQCGMCKFCTAAEGGSHLQKIKGCETEEVDDSCDSNEGSSNDPEQTLPALNIASTTHGHMITIAPCTNTLPSHVIIASLSELPSHFRRVTTKYTRNRCQLLPCRVPHYLLKKHQLLPSVITALPTRKKSGHHQQQLSGMKTTKDAPPISHAMTKNLAVNYYHPNMSDSGEKSTTVKDRQMSAMATKDVQLTAITKDTVMNYTNFNGSGDMKAVAAKNVSKGDTDNRLPHLAVSDQESGMNSGKETKGIARSDQNGRHYHRHSGHHHHGPGAQDQRSAKHHLRRHSHMTQHLGQKFKTEAHTR